MGLQAALRMAKQALDAANAEFKEVKTAAQAEWNSDKAAGLTTQDFFTWVVNNYPQFGVAQQAVSSAAGAYTALVNKISGPGAALVSRYTNQFNSVQNGQPG